MPGSPMQNNMFEATTGYVQKNNPNPVTSCGRRRNDGSPLRSEFDIKSKKEKNKRKNWEPKRNKKNYRSTESGAGMTKAGIEAYKRNNPGSKLKGAVTGTPKKGSKDDKRKDAYCARSAGINKAHPKAAKDPNSRNNEARRRWGC